jgi:UDP-N-acetylglucosamine acyltransferase
VRGHPGNTIHPTAIVDGDVRMGSGNVIGPFCVLTGPLTLGDDNRIGPYACIGTPGDEIKQRDYDVTGKRIEIGSRCLIREHVTVHKPCYGDVTRLGDDVYLMHGAYVAHDTIVEDRAILAQNAAIGGVSRVLEGGYVAMGSALHQRAIVGQYAILGAAAAGIRSLRPFTRFIPSQAVTVNTYAIERYGFAEHREEIERYVLEREPPTSRRLGEMVAHYEALQAAAGGREH